MTIAAIIADEIVDRIYAHVRKHLPECKGKTRHELELMLADLRIEVAEILAEFEDAFDEPLDEPDGVAA
jgi:hypothetical protein